jgi:hypothetical protein
MQVRKAAVSAASNIVEGCAMDRPPKLLNLTEVSMRLKRGDGERVTGSFGELVAKLNALMNSLDGEL